MVMLYPSTLVVGGHPRRLALHIAAVSGDCDLARRVAAQICCHNLQLPPTCWGLPACVPHQS